MAKKCIKALLGIKRRYYIWATFARLFMQMFPISTVSRRCQHRKCEVWSVIKCLYLKVLTSQDVFSDTKQTLDTVLHRFSLKRLMFVSKTERLLKRMHFSNDEDVICTVMAFWNSRKKQSGTMEFARCRNAGPSVYQLRETWVEKWQMSVYIRCFLLQATNFLNVACMYLSKSLQFRAWMLVRCTALPRCTNQQRGM